MEVVCKKAQTGRKSHTGSADLGFILNPDHYFFRQRKRFRTCLVGRRTEMMEMWWKEINKCCLLTLLTARSWLDSSCSAVQLASSRWKKSPEQEASLGGALANGAAPHRHQGQGVPSQHSGDRRRGGRTLGSRRPPTRTSSCLAVTFLPLLYINTLIF